jgi:diguanylate cyclase (GGDEF)-like protein
MTSGEIPELGQLHERLASERRARRAAEEAAGLAQLHDQLTGLPNRTLLLERLAQALSEADGPVTVLYVDLDRFKRVNDTLGHEAGDALLMMVAGRLERSVRATDVVARLNGDEFALVCCGVDDREAALILASRIADEVAAPIRIGDVELSVTASIGIAFHVDGTVSAEDLLRDGDAAMCAAKESGGNAGFLDETARGHDPERLRLESDLRQAVDRSEMRVHYQPVVHLSTLEPVGVEALARWEHPTRGFVSPAEFIPLAEETGLIRTLGEWVLREACRQVGEWNRRGVSRPLELSVNLSLRQLVAKTLPTVVGSALRDAGLSAERLCLELTESVLLQESPVAEANVTALNRLGVRFAIDDFGTGYSSFVHLKRYPTQRLKIDRTFVAGLEEGNEDVAIVAAVVAMAHALGLTTVAEGIESEAQLRELVKLGCDLGQGHYFARALDAESCIAFLTDGGSRRLRAVGE